MGTRINKFVAQATGLSRRHADELIDQARVTVNSQLAAPGISVEADDEVKLNNQLLSVKAIHTIMLNKPVGYVCSRDGQGSETIYDLLPPEFSNLKPVGRLDKNSSGLLLLTNDGDLAHKLTHPSFIKNKVYNVTLNKPLEKEDKSLITHKGVSLSDGLSKLQLEAIGDSKHWQITMHEGRNRQIRRTFEALGYKVETLHRIKFGDYTIDGLESGQNKEL